MTVDRDESRRRVAAAIQAVADWVDANLGSFTWDVDYRPTEQEIEARRQGISRANETLQLLAVAARQRQIDVEEFEYGVNRVNGAGFSGWHLDGRLVQAAVSAIKQQV